MMGSLHNQTPLTFGTLIGVHGGRIQWGRVTTFFVALSVSTLFTTIIWDWVRSPDLIQFLPFSFFLTAVLSPFVVTAAVVLAFRFVHHEILAALVAALLYTLFARGIQFGLGVFETGSGVILVAALIRGFAAQSCFVLAMIFFIRKVKPWSLSVALASFVGGTVTDLTMRIINRVAGLRVADGFFLSPSEEMLGLVLTVISAALFTYVMSAGIGVALAETKRLSKGFFVGSLVGGPFLAMVATLAGVHRGAAHHYDTTYWMPFVFSAMLFWGNTGVIMMTLVYKMWASIPEGHARTTPARALGFLFIPVYSLFWVFQVFWGFAKDYNNYITRQQLNLRRLSEGLCLTFSIFAVVSWIPMLFAVNLFIGPIMVWKICDAVNRLPESGGPPLSLQSANA